jgi:hypothetical protein
MLLANVSSCHSQNHSGWMSHAEKVHQLLALASLLQFVGHGGMHEAKPAHLSLLRLRLDFDGLAQGSPMNVKVVLVPGRVLHSLVVAVAQVADGLHGALVALYGAVIVIHRIL